MATGFNIDANDELWKECAQWLTKWKMIRHDHKVNMPDAKIVDFANILRDGVILCKLLNKIDPGCIDMKSVNLKPTMAQFLCLRNITIFLETATVSFGLKAQDLFEASMLFDLSNFHKVLCALSKISLHPKAKKSNIPGFSAQRGRSREEDEIYQSLQTEHYPARSRSVTEVDNTYDLASEEIYQDLCVLTNAREQLPSYEKRDYVITELVDTEKNYVDVLTTLKKNFMANLKSMLKPEEHDTIFNKINELHEIHTAFYEDLKRVQSVHCHVRLASVFLKWHERFLVYGKYCANLTKATNTLQELCDNNEVLNQLVIKLEKDVNQGRFKLRDVLSVPMQRILKYHLLLEKLIENTDVNHEEYGDLVRARETMLDVACFINEVARDSDLITVIKDVQETIIDWQPAGHLNLLDYGRLLKDGEFRIRAHDQNTKTKNRYMFIFERCILICKQIRGQFSFRAILNIEDYHVDENHNRPIMQKDARFMTNFLLVKNDNSNAYTIFTKSIDLKKSIIKAINDSLDCIEPKIFKQTTHSLEWMTFPNPVQCRYCSKYLKGLILQGYKCSVCNCAFHKLCIQQSRRCCGPRSPELPDHFGIDDPLTIRLWFVGEMDRGNAEANLKNRKNGTYLVRIRPRSDDKDKYALSLKTNSIKHMKIMSTDPSIDPKKFYLSQSKFFNTIEELIMNYQNNSLKENFERLAENTRLLWPFRRIMLRVLKSYEPIDPEVEIRITEGSQIILVEKEGYKEGWWKGANEENDEVGYFPKSHVKVETD